MRTMSKKTKAVSLPESVNKSGESITITERGAVFSKGAEKLPPNIIIDTIKKAAKVETACGFAVGDLANFLVGMKGSDLREIAEATGISASDLKKRSNACARIAYEDRDPQLHLDFHVEASQAPADDRIKFLEMAHHEKMTRQRFKKSIELGREATDDDLKPVIEDNDEGTETFGGAVNRIVVFNGKLDRAGFYDKQTPEELFELHADLMPALEVWAGIVKRFKDKLPAELQVEFKEHLKSLAV